MLEENTVTSVSNLVSNESSKNTVLVKTWMYALLFGIIITVLEFLYFSVTQNDGESRAWMQYFSIIFFLPINILIGFIVVKIKFSTNDWIDFIKTIINIYSRWFILAFIIILLLALFNIKDLFPFEIIMIINFFIFIFLLSIPGFIIFWIKYLITLKK